MSLNRLRWFDVLIPISMMAMSRQLRKGISPILRSKRLIMKYFADSIFVLIIQQGMLLSYVFAINIIAVSQFLLVKNALNFAYRLFPLYVDI